MCRAGFLSDDDEGIAEEKDFRNHARVSAASQFGEDMVVVKCPSRGSIRDHQFHGLANPEANACLEMQSEIAQDQEKKEIERLGMQRLQRFFGRQQNCMLDHVDAVSPESAAAASCIANIKDDADGGREWADSPVNEVSVMLQVEGEQGLPDGQEAVVEHQEEEVEKEAEEKTRDHDDKSSELREDEGSRTDEASPMSEKSGFSFSLSFPTLSPVPGDLSGIVQDVSNFNEVFTSLIPLACVCKFSSLCTRAPVRMRLSGIMLATTNAIAQRPLPYRLACRLALKSVR